jgi:hypothetical protein
MFNNFPVMSLSEDSIMFNLAYLSQAEPIYLDRTNTTEVGATRMGDFPIASAVVKGPQSHEDQSGYVSINPIVSVQPSPVRTMIVRVPANAGPGSVLTVTAPNGNVLSVSYIHIPHVIIVLMKYQSIL